MAILFGIALLFGGLWMGYESTYFLLEGTRTQAVVTRTHYFLRGYDIFYDYKNVSGLSKTSSDHISRFDWYAECPRIVLTIEELTYVKVTRGASGTPLACPNKTHV